ncbi:MAG: M64 family metallopeptidase [Phycisphaerales bacterium JB052]
MDCLGLISITVLATLSGQAFAQQALPQHEPAGTNINEHGQFQEVFGCWEGPDGHLEGGPFLVPADPRALEIREAVEHANRGIPDNRVDMVIVGDGYTADEMDIFHADATNIAESFFRYEPFKSYKPYFKFTQVEVVSNESGVDNDPTEGISRDTALDMGYWCGGTERALCVDVTKAYAAAAAAPHIDQVIAIANSSKYGGVGYPSNNLGTSAGHNSAAVEIVIHEMGHSLGDLADEYTYGGPTTYTGGELGPVDVSILDRDEQLEQERKWWRWMDASFSEFDGPISTYEGGNYSQFGVFRPSNNSMMRNLSRPFNVVSAERLLRMIYREVDPIDDGTPDGSVVEPDEVLWVTPMQPLNHDLQVLWYLDDEVILSAVQETELDLSTLSLGSGEHTIKVEVIDPTPWVRAEVIRRGFMREVRTYTVSVCRSDADLNQDGNLDFFDVSAFLTAYNAQEPLADMNNDGEYSFFDVSAFLVMFSKGGCP